MPPSFQGYVVGCDVSKAKLDLAVLAPDQTVQHSFMVANTKAGCRDAVKRLTPYMGVRVIIEATSSYHYLIAFALRDAGFGVVVINPLLTKKYALSAIRKTKTDRVDAVLLGQIGLIEPHLHPFTETREMIEKKQLTKAIRGLRQERTRLFQKTQAIGEMTLVCGKEMDVAAKAIQQVVKTIDAKIKLLQKHLLVLTEREARLVASIPGIGIGSAAMIVAELGDISRFDNRDQVVAFAGLDPSIRESGSSVRGRSHITKRGSNALRGVLGQVAWGAMMHNPYFRQYYERKKAEGKHYFTTLVAMSRKLLLIIFGMLKSGKVYDASRYPQLVA